MDKCSKLPSLKNLLLSLLKVYFHMAMHWSMVLVRMGSNARQPKFLGMSQICILNDVARIFAVKIYTFIDDFLLINLHLVVVVSLGFVKWGEMADKREQTGTNKEIFFQQGYGTNSGDNTVRIFSRYLPIIRRMME